MTIQKEKKTEAIKVRVTENLLRTLQKEAKVIGLSVNGYINFKLNSLLEKQGIAFNEKIGKREKKEVESRVYFTASEIGLLEKHAELNGWSVSKEIRYRIVSTLAKKPKLNKEELKAIYSVRSSINILGANINRLVRDDESLSDNNIEVCKGLIGLMKELKDKVNYLEKCSYSSFELEEKGGVDGS